MDDAVGGIFFFFLFSLRILNRIKEYFERLFEWFLIYIYISEEEVLNTVFHILAKFC